MSSCLWGSSHCQMILRPGASVPQNVQRFFISACGSKPFLWPWSLVPWPQLHFGAHFVALCCLWTCHCFFWVFPCFSDRPAACEVTKCRNRKRHLKRGGGIDRRPYQDPFCPGAGNEQLGTVSTAHTACVPLKGNSHTWQDANQKLRVI